MILNPAKRRRKAFALAFKIISSYLILRATKKLRSDKFYNTKISKLHEKNAVRVKTTILELNGLFIKVGQLLSNLSAVLPKSYATILESLQDSTPHSQFDIIQKSIENQLEDSVDNLFQEIEHTPIASASIGQVHKATLKTGEQVVVKIQHPYIKDLAIIDLDIIEKIHKKITRFFEIKGLDHAFEQVKQMIYEELDYNKEAQSMFTIKENCKEIDEVLIPKVFSEYCSSQILVSEFVDGVKITNIKQLDEWEVDRNQLMEKLVYSYCEMILNHGIYHADPHPGNLMVNKEGKLVFIDFGAVGELKEEMRVGIPAFLQAIISEDDEKVMKSLQEMGFVGKGKEKDKATKKIIEALTEFLQDAISLESINFDTIQQSSMYKLQKELSIKELTSSLDVPKDWILLERTLLLLYGISTNIAPDYSAMDTIKPYLKKLVLKDGGLQKIIIDTIKQQATTLFSLPKKIDAYLSKANKGELEFELKGFENHSKRLIAVNQQLVYAIVAIVSLCGGLISNLYNKENYETLFITLSISFGVLFLYSKWKNRK
ncbi:MAG: ABC1 kinase family protein [Flavobacteriales bacterium]